MVVGALISKDLPDFPAWRSGSSKPLALHRHDAHAFVYVPEGSIVIQVRGEPEMTLSPGQGYCAKK